MVGGGYYDMTKKFWNDWKNRIGETKQVYYYQSSEEKRLWYSHNLLGYYGDNIKHASFNGNIVDLTIERFKYKGYNSRTKSEIWEKYDEHVTLNRKQIVSIVFHRF